MVFTSNISVFPHSVLVYLQMYDLISVLGSPPKSLLWRTQSSKVRLLLPRQRRALFRQLGTERPLHNLHVDFSARAKRGHVVKVGALVGQGHLGQRAALPNDIISVAPMDVAKRPVRGACKGVAIRLHRRQLLGELDQLCRAFEVLAAFAVGKVEVAGPHLSTVADELAAALDRMDLRREDLGRLHRILSDAVWMEQIV